MLPPTASIADMKTKKKRKSLIERLKKIPHLFAKIIITHCIVVVTIAAYCSLYAQYRGADMVALFAAIAAPFISELVMLLLKTLFANKEGDKNENTHEELHI